MITTPSRSPRAAAPRDRPFTPERLGRASLGMAIATTLSRLSGFAKLFALAYALGVTSLADSYNLANTTPNIIYDLVLGGVLAGTAIPVLVERIAREEPEQAWADISSVMTVATVVLVAATVAFEVLAPAIVRLYTSTNHAPDLRAQRAAATELLRLFAPQVLFYGASSLMAAVLNARRRFAAPMLVPTANNLLVIGVLLVAARVYHYPSLVSAVHDRGLMLLLGLGTSAGVALQAALLLPSLRRAVPLVGRPGGRLRPGLRWRWDPHNAAVRLILRLSGWTLGFVLANQVALFVVITLADGAGRGAVSAWTYAYQFFQLPYGVLAVSLMSAYQPGLAERWALGDRAAFGRRAGSGLRAVTSAVMPAAAGYAVLAGPITSLVLAHGHGAISGAGATGQVLFWLSLGLPGFCAYLFVVRAFQAAQDTRSAFFLYLLENGLNVVLAVVLIGPLGVRGLALALSVAYTVAAVAAAATLAKRAPIRPRGVGVGRAVLRSGASSTLMAVVVALTVAHVGAAHGVGLLVRVLAGLAVGVSVFATGVGVGTALSGSRTNRSTARRRR